MKKNEKNKKDEKREERREGKGREGGGEIQAINKQPDGKKKREKKV